MGYRLHPDDIDAIAQKVVDRLSTKPIFPQTGLVNGFAAARRLGVSRDWVRTHAAELGAVRMGEARNDELRYPPEALEEYIRSHTLRKSSDG